MYYDYADLNVINKELTGIWQGWTAVKLLGKGAFGAVYEIHRENADVLLEKAALKVLRVPENDIEIMQLRAEGVSRGKTESYYEKYIADVENEILIMQKLVGNSHLVSYEDYSIRKRTEEIGWDVYIRMELLTGLADYMKNHRLTEKMALKLGMDISQGLRDCHRKGIIHRDIKPQNIFVNEAGSFKLGDFGVSRTAPGALDALSFKGTLAYMAPEVYKKVSTDERSDIYSLGMVLYQCLNGGRLPFVPEQFTPEDLENSRIRRFNGEQVIEPAYGSDGFKRVVLTAIAPRPEDRYQTAEEMYQALLDVRSGKIPAVPAARRSAVSQADGAADRNIQNSQYHPGGRTVQKSSGTRAIILAGAAAAVITVIAASALLYRTSKSGIADKQLIPGLPGHTSETGAEGQTGEQTAQTGTGAAEGKPEETAKSDAAAGKTVESLQSQPAAAEDLRDDTGEDHKSTEPSALDQEDESEEDYVIEWKDNILEEKVRELVGIPTGDVMYSDVKDLTSIKLTADPYDVDSNLIHDISNFHSMPKLEHIYLEFNRVSDISVLSELTNLKELWICENILTDISPLVGLPDLQILNIGGNQIDDFSPLKEMTTLRKLYWEKSNVWDCNYIVDTVSSMPNLKTLIIGINNLSNMSALSSLTDLEELWISASNISDISFLSSLTNLKSLNASNNNISDISVLSNLTKLSSLDLSGNRISDISALSGLTSLRVLNLKNNQISDYSPIEDLHIAREQR